MLERLSIPREGGRLAVRRSCPGIVWTPTALGLRPKSIELEIRDAYPWTSSEDSMRGLPAHFERTDRCRTRLSSLYRAVLAMYGSLDTYGAVAIAPDQNDCHSTSVAHRDRRLTLQVHVIKRLWYWRVVAIRCVDRFVRT